MMNQSNNSENTNRYSDDELEEFRLMIEQKLVDANGQLENLRGQLTDLNESDETSKAGTFEDGASTWQREHINKLAARQQSFIRDLEYALIRVRNKTYGICSVTGKLIEKKRLQLVPHATKTIEGKESENEDSRQRRPLSVQPEKKPITTKKIITKVISTSQKKYDNIDEFGDLDDMDENNENLGLDDDLFLDNEK
jgi:RNA polymerase-binding transcription factor DksA